MVAKTHLDLGFTGLAAEVVDRYVERFFPAAIAAARQLRLADSPLRLVWTTGSWILREALERAGTERSRAEVADAIEHGDLAWHALPLTTHTELMDAALFRHGLGISGALDRRFGRRTIAAKLTDVPGHTRSMVPLLVEAGVRFVHIGVNPVWPMPDVPAVFRWHDDDGSEVVVAYQAGGYGGEVIVDGCDEVLSFLHSGDNLGPPSIDDVHHAFRTLSERYPDAEIVGSTLDGFARALFSSGAVASLPTVTAEIGDPWIFGAASDPQKMSKFRRLLRARRAPMLDPAERTGIDDALLLVCEHTWGLDEKIALPDVGPWDRAGLERLRSTRDGRRFEASWDEQRGYLAQAVQLMRRAGIEPEPDPGWTFHDLGNDDHADWRRLEPGADVTLADWQMRFDETTGAVTGLVHPSGRPLAEDEHRLATLTYQSFDEADYEAFATGLTIAAADEAWAFRDNGKPGSDVGGARSARWPAAVDGMWLREASSSNAAQVVLRHRFAREAVEELGAPPAIFTEWAIWPGADVVSAVVAWVDKPASRLPEALWCGWNPRVDVPARWRIDKLGQPVSPLDVVRYGGRRLHGVGDAISYDGPEGTVSLDTCDAPLVAPGGGRLLDADPALPDLARGFAVLLHDNCWGTNFPMWSEGAATFRFRLHVG